MKLGKLAPADDPRTLTLAKYLAVEALPKVPVRRVWSKAVTTWPMMGNDTIGDCTIAAAGHMIEGWTGNNGSAVVVPDRDIISVYSAITGYRPGNPASDQGAVELDVLNYWRNSGIAGHKILAYVSIDPHNHPHVKAAIDLFGGVYIGVALPISAQSEVGPHKTWRAATGPDGKPGSWGGHAVPVLDYDGSGLECVTWGALQHMSWGFWDEYCDEAYAILSPEWLGPKGAPSGFDLATLQADLGAL